MAPMDSLWSDPVNALRESIKNVPAVRWALGVVGVAAAAGIAVSFFSDPLAALAASAVMVFLMVLLFVFSRLIKARSKYFQIPVIILTWGTVLIFLTWGVVITSSALVEWPRTLPEIISSIGSAAGLVSSPDESENGYPNSPSGEANEESVQRAPNNETLTWVGSDAARWHEKAQELLNHYKDYLSGAGFAQSLPSVEIEYSPESSTQGAAYEHNSGRILVHFRSLHPSIIYREYMHAVLYTPSFSDLQWNIDFRAIASALAWYFPSSFEDDPNTPLKFPSGPGIYEAYSFPLENRKKYTDFTTMRPESPRHTGTESERYIYHVHQAWAGVFWDLRKVMGAMIADQLLVSAWESLRSIRTGNVTELFVQRLLDETQNRGDAEKLTAVERAISAREFLSER